MSANSCKGRAKFLICSWPMTRVVKALATNGWTLEDVRVLILTALPAVKESTLVSVYQEGKSPRVKNRYGDPAPLSKRQLQSLRDYLDFLEEEV